MAELRLAFLLAVLFLAALAVTGQLQFVARECPTRARRVLAVLVLVGVLTLAVFYPVTSAGGAADLNPATIWFPSLFAGHAILVSALALWWVLCDKPPWRHFLVVPAHDPTDSIRTGLIAGALGWVVTIAVMGVIGTVATFIGHSPGGTPEIPPIMIWLAELPIAYKLVIIVVAMTVEELFFRAFLQTRLGLWLSSILFALAHFSYGLPFMVAAVLTISLIIGVLFRRTGSVIPCMAAHGLFDAIQLLVVLPVIVGPLSR